MTAREMTTLLHRLLNDHNLVVEAYQYPNDDFATRQDGLLIQMVDGSVFRISVTKTMDTSGS